MGMHVIGPHRIFVRIKWLIYGKLWDLAITHKCYFLKMYSLLLLLYIYYIKVFEEDILKHCLFPFTWEKERLEKSKWPLWLTEKLKAFP